MGIFQTVIGITSWESHPCMVLMWPSPLLLTVAGRKYHYPSVQVIAHLLPHKFRELLFIARCVIGCLCKNSLEVIFGDYSFRLTASVVRPNFLPAAAHVLAERPCRFILVRPYRVRYLKYWYSIFKERRGEILPSNI